ncbi:MAG: DUF6305 family protein [Tissierellia bacterium]|nr:DUF6305 family protein [Tissierellia bacterium]
MKKRLLIILTLLLSTFVLFGCGSNNEANETKETQTEAEKDNAENKDNKADADAEVKSLEAPIAETPVILTSIGQSADVEMIKALLDNAEMDYEMDKLVKADGLGDQKTLLLAVGGSSKGLGAAGIDADQELDRTKDLIAKAQEKGMTIIVVHVGGENRRGELSDKFIRPTAEAASYIIVEKSGNQDNLFTDIAKEKGIPMDTVDSIADAITPLKAAFK